MIIRIKLVKLHAIHTIGNINHTHYDNKSTHYKTPHTHTKWHPLTDLGLTGGGGFHL